MTKTKIYPIVKDCLIVTALDEYGELVSASYKLEKVERVKWLVCSKCRERKPVYRFDKAQNARGRNYNCRECCAARVRNWRKKTLTFAIK